MNDQNQAMLELADSIEQRHSDDHNGNRSYLFTREQRDLIVTALRAGAPSPHPRGEEPVAQLADEVVARVINYETRQNPSDWDEPMAISASELKVELLKFAGAVCAAPSPHPTREEIAAILNPVAFTVNERMKDSDTKAEMRASALRKADAILALFAAPPPAGADAVQLQARPAEGGDWIDIYPSQLEWMAKEGHSVRAVDAPAGADAVEPIAVAWRWRWGCDDLWKFTDVAVEIKGVYEVERLGKIVPAGADAVREARQALSDFKRLCRTDISRDAGDALKRLAAALALLPAPQPQEKPGAALPDDLREESK